MADVAIVSVISTAIVAVAGLGFNWWNARESRQHEEKLARGQRNYEARQHVTWRSG